MLYLPKSPSSRSRTTCIILLSSSTLAFREPVQPDALVDSTGLGHMEPPSLPPIRYSGINDKVRSVRNVINLSDYIPSKDELELLSLGLSFIPSTCPGQFSSDELTSDFATLRDGHMARYSCGLPLTSSRIKDNVCNQLEQHITHLQLRHTDSNLLPRLRKALKSLKENTSIVISKADKGDAAVLLNAA